MANWHRLRKSIHAGCFLAFLALPFLNIVRFDIPRQRFYFFGYELWINEFAIVFFALMFLMFLVVASSVFYGRVYCGYMCPQMIFSEASVSLESRLQRWMVKRGRSKGAGHVLFYAILAAASVALALILMAYFVEPRDLFRRLVSLDIHTAGGISGAAVTAVTFLDFALVRQRFCTTVCPYGYLQGMLGDGNTLLVHYRDEGHACIECKKCVRVCPMGIDIRKSPFQIECIHCAECIDACDKILGRRGKPGLIHYAWGEHGPLSKGHRQPWDARRIVVLAIVVLYAGGLLTALSMRKPLLARVSPDRSVMYRVGPDGRIYNRFQYTLANRGKTAVSAPISTRDLPGAQLSLRTVSLRAGESANGEFEISAPGVRRGDVVTHFTIVFGDEKIPMTFLAPVEGK
jgi:cytochrome c oxidase accessory protein FixG